MNSFSSNIPVLPNAKLTRPDFVVLAVEQVWVCDYTSVKRYGPVAKKLHRYTFNQTTIASIHLCKATTEGIHFVQMTNTQFYERMGSIRLGREPYQDPDGSEAIILWCGREATIYTVAPRHT